VQEVLENIKGNIERGSSLTGRRTKLFGALEDSKEQDEGTQYDQIQYFK